MTRGEGVLGLTSAFLAAGVPCVVATLWPVDDRVTVDFVGEFYNSLSDGRSVAAALCEAQTTIRGRAATRHPFFWAAFVTVGDGDVTADISPRRHWPVRTVVSILAFAALVFVCAHFARVARRLS